MEKCKVFFLLIIIFVSVGFASDSLNLRCAGVWPYSRSYYIEVSSNTTYLSVGCGLWIFNTSNPANPIKVAELPIASGGIRDMVKEGNYLYLANLETGLTILNVTNPIAPVIQSVFRIKRQPLGLSVDSMYAYIVSFDTFYIVNISNPSQPSLISATQVIGMSWHVFTHQSRAYICQSSRGFVIYDISNPATPFQLGSWNPTSYRGSKDIWVKDSFAYVANNETLRIFSVSDPQNIYQLGKWGLSNSMMPYPCIAKIWLKDSLAFLAFEHAGVQIINVANPQSPFRCGYYQFNNCDVRDVMVIDSLAYVSDGYGFGILNVSDPYQPTIVARWIDCPGFINNVSLTNNNNLACLACLQGVWFFDITNLANPTLQSFLQYPQTYAVGIVAKDSFVYVSIFDSLLVINIANPISPMVVGRLPLDWARAMFLRNNLLYVPSVDGFYIVNVTNPLSPTILGYAEYDADPYGIFVLGDYAYIGAGTYQEDEDYGGFRIFNIANPNNPYQVGQYIPDFDYGVIKGIWVHDSIAFVCDDGNGLFIFNVANPLNPVYLYYYSNFFPSDIIIRDNIAFLADSYYGIKVLDISNLSSIQVIGYYTGQFGSGYATNIELVSNYIHVTRWDAGYFILEYYGTGIEETSSISLGRKLNLKVLPKPINKSFLLEYDITKNNVVTLDILDTLGRVKKTIKKGQAEPGNYQLNINVSDLPAGVYFIRLKQGEEQTVERFVIVK